MTQPTPTPLPNHGTGWGLLFLFIYLYGIGALLGIGTMAVIALTQFERRVPKILQYLVVVALLGALGLSGFISLVAGTTGRYDVVALILLTVFLPLTLKVLFRRRRNGGRLAILTHAALAWSLPFLVGFGVIAVVGTSSGGISPEFASILAVIIVVTGTVLIGRLPIFPDVELLCE